MAQYAKYSGLGGSGGGGSVNSVTASSPLASSGGANPNISLTGIVSIANGGTGQATANAALNALLPSQTIHAGEFLTTDGVNTSWASIGSTNVVVEYHTISAPEAAAKQFTLSNTPTIANEALVDIISGCSQIFGVDFTISTNVFDWNGLALDGIIGAGDIVRLNYLT